MTDLSPAAQAVLDAFVLDAGKGHRHQSAAVAAALRAAADYDPPDNPDAAYDMGWYAGMEFIQSIAEELEAQ
jgi:hypothetical protein